MVIQMVDVAADLSHFLSFSPLLPYIVCLQASEYQKWKWRGKM